MWGFKAGKNKSTAASFIETAVSLGDLGVVTSLIETADCVGI